MVKSNLYERLNESKLEHKNTLWQKAFHMQQKFGEEFMFVTSVRRHSPMADAVARNQSTFLSAYHDQHDRDELAVLSVFGIVVVFC